MDIYFHNVRDIEIDKYRTCDQINYDITIYTPKGTTNIMLGSKNKSIELLFNVLSDEEAEQVNQENRRMRR